MLRKTLGYGAAVTAALLLSAASASAAGHGGGGHGGGGHGGGGFHSSGGGFHSSGFHSGGWSHSSGFHSGFHNGFRSNRFFFGFGFPYYYPYYSSYYYPSYYYPYDYGYSQPYYDYSYSPVTLYTPRTNYRIISQPTGVMPYADSSSLQTQPGGAGYTPSPDGTYPYNGGPRSPVPMPKEAPPPSAAPPASSAPLEGTTVSRVVAKSKYTYLAYGEGSTSVAGTKAADKQTVKKTNGD